MPEVCSLSNIWFSNPDNKQWLETSPADETFAKCKACNTVFNIVSLVEKALRSHAKGQKHARNLEILLASSQMNQVASHFSGDEVDDGSVSVDLPMIHRSPHYFTTDPDAEQIVEVIVEGPSGQPEEIVRHIIKLDRQTCSCPICGTTILQSHLEDHIRMTHTEVLLEHAEDLSFGRVVQKNETSEVNGSVSKRGGVIGSEEVKAVNAILALTEELAVDIDVGQQVTLDVCHAEGDSLQVKQRTLEYVEEKTDDHGDEDRAESSLTQQTVRRTFEKPFKCSVCNATCGTELNLKVHMMKHVGQQPYKCGVCAAACATKDSLKEHMVIHQDRNPNLLDLLTTKKPCLCEVCGKALSSKQSLATHMLKHKGERPFKCDECGAGYFCRASLIQHKTLHKEGKPLSRRARRQKDYSLQTRHHPDVKPFICDYCGMAFSKNDYLTYHTRKHTGEKPYMCNVCGREFTREDCFKRHARTHSAEKPFKCDVCNKGFNYQSQLVPHKRLHTGERPFVCSECGSGFVRRDKLNEHMLKHTGRKKYVCGLCGVGFTTNRCLKKHKLQHADVTLQQSYSRSIILMQ